MKQRILVCLLALAMVFSLFGCTKNGVDKTGGKEENKVEQTTDNKSEEKETPKEEEASHYPVTITTYNYEGEPVEQTFEKAPEKVIAIYQSALENLLALGLGDRIIYTGGMDVEVKDEWKDELAKVQTVGETSLSKEAVLDMEPDMICSWKSYFGEKMLGDIPFWHERGIHTYAMLNSGIKKPNKLEYEYEDILTLGKIFDREEKAQKLVDAMKDDIKKAQDYAEGKEKIKTVIMEVEKENTFRNYGGDSIGGNIAELAGADLVIPKNGSFGPEELVESNPEVIFTVYYGDEILKDDAVKAIMENPALQSVSAIQNKRVYAIMLSEVYASGVRTADGIRSIIEGLYPEK